MVAPNGNTVAGSTRFVIPTGQVTIHSTGDGGLGGPGATLSWPSAGGRDLSWYGGWGSWLGFFVPTASADFFGLYDPAGVALGRERFDQFR